MCVAEEERRTLPLGDYVASVYPLEVGPRRLRGDIATEHVPRHVGLFQRCLFVWLTCFLDDGSAKEDAILPRKEGEEKGRTDFLDIVTNSDGRMLAQYCCWVTNSSVWRKLTETRLKGTTRSDSGQTPKYLPLRHVTAGLGKMWPSTDRLAEVMRAPKAELRPADAGLSFP